MDRKFSRDQTFRESIRREGIKRVGFMLLITSGGPAKAAPLAILRLVGHNSQRILLEKFGGIHEASHFR